MTKSSNNFAYMFRFYTTYIYNANPFSCAGEEDEVQLFCERGKLYRWAEETKEWKERGLGEIKILSNTGANTLRILMRREKTLKICANHYITSDMKMNLRADSEKAVTWAANDFADSEMVREKFTIKFKNPELASSFKRTFEKAQESEAGKSCTDAGKSTSDVAVVSSKTTESLADKFKPAAGSWECSSCLVRNKSEDSNCLACKASRPGAPSTAPLKAPAVDAKTKDLAAMFRPAAGSWECDTCLVRNKPASIICEACKTVKPGCVAPKENKESTEASPFSFGIAAGSASTNASTQFTASALKFGLSGESSSSAISFGLPVSTKTDSVPVATTSFLFKPQTETQTPSKSTHQPSNFNFGSPDKFVFSFKPMSPRSRDVSQCESEDGVVEEDEGDHLYFEVSTSVNSCKYHVICI